MRLGVTPDQVVVTSGADEALFLVASVCLGPERTAIIPDPVSPCSELVSEAVGGRVVKLPLGRRTADVPRRSLLEAVRDPSVGVVWLCNPNNPTGRLLHADVLEAVLEAAPDAIVALDEAYHEISGHSLAPMLLYAAIERRAHRTFSKGLRTRLARVRYLVGHRTRPRAVESVRLPQNA